MLKILKIRLTTDHCYVVLGYFDVLGITESYDHKSALPDEDNL